MKIKIILIPFFISIFFASCEKLTKKHKDDYIKIGVLLPYTGALSSFAEELREAMELAVLEINASGSIFGKPIDLLVKDTEANPKIALEKAKELAEEGVVGIIVANSEVTVAVAEGFTIKNDLLLLSLNSTTPLLTDIEAQTKTDLVFRTILSDAITGKVTARQAIELFNCKTAGIIYIDNIYGRGLAENFKAEFEKLGGDILNLVSYPDMNKDELNNYDFKSDVKKLFNKNPDLVFMVTFLSDGAKITIAASQYLSDDCKPILLGCDGNKGEDFLLNSAPEVIEGMYSIIPIAPTESANYLKFAEAYQAKYNKIPNSYLENAYDAVYLFALAMVAANSQISKDIAAQLRNVASSGKIVGPNDFLNAKNWINSGIDIDYQGASGDIEFDNYGDITQGYYGIYKIENSAYHKISTISFP